MASAGLSSFVPSHNTSEYLLESQDLEIIRSSDPQSNEKREKFTICNSWLFSMYAKKLLTLKGRKLARRHGQRMQFGNAFQLLRDLDKYYTVTVDGETFKAAYLEILQEYVSLWKDSYKSLISLWTYTWEKLADLDLHYNRDLIKISHFLNVLCDDPVFQVMISQNEMVTTHLCCQGALSFDGWLFKLHWPPCMLTRQIFQKFLKPGKIASIMPIWVSTLKNLMLIPMIKVMIIS